MEFWSAEELRKEFEAVASFNQVKVGTKVGVSG